METILFAVYYGGVPVLISLLVMQYLNRALARLNRDRLQSGEGE